MGGFAATFEEAAQLLEEGAQTFNGTWESVKTGLVNAGNAFVNGAGQLVKYVTGSGAATAGATAVAGKSALTVATATETTTAAGAVTTTVTPAAVISGAPLSSVILGSLAFFGLAAVGADATTKIVHQLEDYWNGDFSHSWRDQTGLYDEIARRVRIYMDKSGKTYVDGTTLEIIGNSLAAIGAFEEAGYSTTDVPLNTIVRVETLSYSDSKDFFKSKFAEIAPEAKQEVVSKAIDVLFEYMYSTLGLIPNTSNLLVLTCTSDFNSMHLYFHMSEEYSFTKYVLEYINTGVLATSGNKVTGKMYTDGVVTAHSVYNIYTYGMSGGNPGATHNVTTTSDFAYPGGLYIYDNAVSKGEGYEGIKKVGTFPSLLDAMSFATTADKTGTNSYPVDDVIPKEITYPGVAAKDIPVIYPLTMPIVQPSGVAVDIPQDVVHTGVNDLVIDNPAIPDVKVENPAITDIVDSFPATPEVIPQDVVIPNVIVIDVPVPAPIDPPSIPVPSAGIPGTGLGAIYNPTQSQLASFSRWLWSSDFVDTVARLFQDPMDAIIGLHMLFATPSTIGSSTIQVGYLDSGVSSKIASSQYININCGTIKINKYFNSVLDYAPYTSIKCYLPFIGIVDLDTNELIGSTVSINYRVDVLTGACLAQISVSRNDFNSILYTFSGNCAIQLPITSANYGNILKGAITGGVAGIATGGMVGGIVGAASGGFMGGLRVAHSGDISSNAGAMGRKIPYLIITRPTPYEANNYSSYYGLPSNKTVKLSSCLGYTRVKDIHLENISGATDEELNEIESLLKEGVII